MFEEWITSAVLKLKSLDPWQYLKYFYNVRELKVISIIYSEFPFALHSHFLMSEFFKGCMMCDIAADWMQKEIGEFSCLLLNQIAKKLHEHKTKSLFSLIYACFEKIHSLVSLKYIIYTITYCIYLFILFLYRFLNKGFFHMQF